MVWVNDKTTARPYIMGETAAAGAVAGYAHLEPGDVVDPDEGLDVFSYRWTHVRTGKTGINRVACYSAEDFRLYLARWNAASPTFWTFKEE